LPLQERFLDIAYSVDGVPIRLTAERWFHIVENHKEQGNMESDLTMAAPIFHAAPCLTRFPSKRFWVDYDEEADVLYISLERPQKATDSEMTEDGLLLRYRDKRLGGITVLNVSTRK
jgi:uncharacterized protein YuzE